MLGVEADVAPADGGFVAEDGAERRVSLWASSNPFPEKATSDETTTRPAIS
jgi:hypothetical protein